MQNSPQLLDSMHDKLAFLQWHVLLMHFFLDWQTVSSIKFSGAGRFVINAGSSFSPSGFIQPFSTGEGRLRKGRSAFFHM